jgi:Phage integrase family
VQGYREKAGMSQPIHPHLFRHQMLTYLTTKGLSDAQIQLISGHESKKSLEVYQHLSLESVDKAYQDAVQSVGIQRDFCGTLRTFVGLTPLLATRGREPHPAGRFTFSTRLRRERAENSAPLQG